MGIGLLPIYELQREAGRICSHGISIESPPQETQEGLLDNNSAPKTKSSNPNHQYGTGRDQSHSTVLPCT